MFVTLNFGPVDGLSAEELQQLQDLLAGLIVKGARGLVA